MKLRNKKTGGLANIDELRVYTDAGFHDYSSLADLNDEWEDCEYTKDHWHIGCEGNVYIDNTERCLKSYSSLGNDFETKEEAEKAVEKLKAVKRLKDLDFRFIGKTCEYKSDKHFGSVFFEISGDILDTYDDNLDFYDDLDLLFGGEK